MDLTADEYARRDADRLKQILAGPPVTWLFLGDSITQAALHTRGRRGFVEHFAERVRGELARVRDAVINTGVSGSRAEDALPEFHWRVGRFAPDVVFAMFGTNDAADGPDGVRSFRYALDQVVQRSRDIGATVVLQTPPTVTAGGPRDPQVLARYAAEVRDLAHDLGVVLVDHQARWSEACDDAWFDDPSHPSAVGHIEMARTVFEVAGVADESSATYSLRLEEASAP
ncbi:MAG: SGNH/GDSL hydrolase family protein [Micrococcales bacterium]|nr:SGNH/GDSL hydrolase family protein [Micrococcales bacterium]